MIKLDPIKTVTSSKVSRNKKATRSEGTFQLPSDQSAAENSALPSVGASDMVSTLMGLQEITALNPQQRRLKEHGEKLLDDLDKLRMALLEGRFSSAHLKEIAQRLHQQKNNFDNSHIASVVKEIEQRVAVELAKIEMSESQKKALPQYDESSNFSTQN